MRTAFVASACLGVITALSMGQSAATALVVNLDGAKWAHGKRDPPGAESVVLREDARTEGLELLVSYPAGHVFAPHWHESNERIVLLEGRLSLRQGDGEKFLDPGGYAYLPAREVQQNSCVSKGRCRFYVSWDGNPKSYTSPK